MPHCCGTDGVGATSQGSGRLWLLEEPGGESPGASRRGTACHNPVSPQGDCAGRLTQELSEDGSGSPPDTTLVVVSYSSRERSRPVRLPP